MNDINIIQYAQQLLSEDNVYFNELLISKVYSDDWKSIIQNLINDESLTITNCLTESRCSPFFQ